MIHGARDVLRTVQKPLKAGAAVFRTFFMENLRFPFGPTLMLGQMSVHEELRVVHCLQPGIGHQLTFSRFKNNRLACVLLEQVMQILCNIPLELTVLELNVGESNIAKEKRIWFNRKTPQKIMFSPTDC